MATATVGSARPGLIMHPLLLCSMVDCHYSEAPNRLRGLPDAHADLKCPECGNRLMLVTYGIVESEASLSDLAEWGLRRCEGTWWR